MTDKNEPNRDILQCDDGHYHLIFQDWEASMRRQGEVIASLLRRPAEVSPILVRACGIEAAHPGQRRRPYRSNGHARCTARRQRAPDPDLYHAQVHNVCDTYGDVATASPLANWIDETERRNWFLFEATRGRPGQTTEPVSHLA